MFVLFRLALRRLRSPADYRKLQSYIAEKSIAELKARGVVFSSASVLELGAGDGGYSLILNRESQCFIASDLQRSPWVDTSKIPFIQFDVLKSFPFKKNTFDLIYCSSVIEHVPNPDHLLKECRRILKPDAKLYLSFPPFFSLALVGGHQFKPFHFFGEKIAIRLANFVGRANYENYASAFGKFGLYPLTVDQVKNLITAHNFEIIDIFTRMSPINTARFPGIIKDLMTWHACYLSRASEES